MDYLGSLVLEPHLNHTDAQACLRSQSLPHLEEIGHVSVRHTLASQSRRQDISWAVQGEAHVTVLSRDLFVINVQIYANTSSCFLSGREGIFHKVKTEKKCSCIQVCIPRGHFGTLIL